MTVGSRSIALTFAVRSVGREVLPERIPNARVPNTLPVVLSIAEVARLIEAVDEVVCRTALATVPARARWR